MCVPLVKSASFASLSLLPPTVLALFLRRFVRFTRFFLLLTSPHTALLLHSSGCHPPPPLPSLQHPQCNSSRFLAAVPSGPAFLRPSNCSAACLPACLPARRSTCSNWVQCEGCCSAPELSDRSNNAPQWPRHDICGRRRTRARARAHTQTHRASILYISVCLNAAVEEEVFRSLS